MRATRSVAAGLAVGLLAAACTSGYRQRRADPGAAGTPDPCALVTRREAEVAVHGRLTGPQRTSPIFERSPTPGQRVCRFAPDGLFSAESVDLVVYPDPDGASLRELRAAVLADPKLSSHATAPAGLGSDAVQSTGLLFAAKDGFDLGIAASRGSDADVRKLARAAYQRL